MFIRQTAVYQGIGLKTQIRSALLGLLFRKITKVSQYMAKSQRLGKIINMLSNDFNIIDAKSRMFFGAFSAPIIFVGVIAILITRLGWPGVICPLVIIVLIPVQILIGKMNGSILQDINVHKDERVKLCTEIIEGIKFIKLYGWEVAFKRIIQTLREREIRNFLKLSLVKSLERGFAISMAFWAGFVYFLVAHFTDQSDLTNAKIFSTL